MLLTALFALALANADPAPADAVGAPSVKAETFTPAPEEPFPIGAPTDDYGFVSWCYGALAGHMDLYKVVKPELDKLPDSSPKETATLDAEQMKAGQEYLELYKRAMVAAEKASPQPINVHGAQSLKVGASIWGPALQADPKTRMWSYLSWDLPGRCETTAEKLYEKSLLSAQALGVTIENTDDKPKAADGKADGATADAPKAADKPARKKTAAAADLRGAE